MVLTPRLSLLFRLGETEPTGSGLDAKRTFAQHTVSAGSIRVCLAACLLPLPPSDGLFATCHPDLPRAIKPATLRLPSCPPPPSLSGSGEQVVSRTAMTLCGERCMLACHMGIAGSGKRRHAGGDACCTAKAVPATLPSAWAPLPPASAIGIFPPPLRAHYLLWRRLATRLFAAAPLRRACSMRCFSASRMPPAPHFIYAVV